MYIEPNSKIILCNNVPLDNTYQHTIYFANANAQTNYFLSKAKATLQEQTYQRVVKGKMRVQRTADSIYDCNYLMFQNTTYGSKWFYAFITGIEYVNDVTSEVTFELDDLQTYFFDTELMPCYVEREHTADDTIGANLVKEDIGVPELCVMNVYTRYWGSGDWKCAILVEPSILGEFVGMGDPINAANGQLYPPTYEVDMSAVDLTLLNQFLKGVEIIGAVCGGYFFPREFGDTIAPIPINDLNTYGITRPTKYTDYGSAGVLPTEYTPKNNKLFTYPYTKMIASSTNGTTAEYKWEDTRDGYVKFNLHHNHLNKASCELRPTNYFRNPQSRMNCVEIQEFPQVTFSYNPSLGFGEIYNALTSMVGLNADGDVDSDNMTMTGMTHLVASRPSAKTGVTNGNLDLKYNSFGFVFYQMGVRAQDAKVIDDYFSMYGYATKAIKVPNRNVRTQWTYCKTKNCNVKANAPADSVKKICSIYDKGITFWRNPSNVGNYNLSNPIG